MAVEVQPDAADSVAPVDSSDSDEDDSEDETEESVSEATVVLLSSHQQCGYQTLARGPNLTHDVVIFGP